MLSAISTALITAAIFTLTACNKDQKDSEDTGYASDHATLEKTFSDAQSVTDEADADGNLSNFKIVPGNTTLSNCATITRDTISLPHVLTVDFGSSNCLCSDGIYRRGQLIVTYTGAYREIGRTHTITFNNYFSNDNQVTGTKTVAYLANDASGNPKFDITVDGAIILASNNGTISWTSARTRTWLSGFNTKTWNDDVFEINGSGTITRANGKIFAIDITTPLHIARDCRWIESGVVNVVPDGGNTRTIDYGNGACDALAEFSVNGKTYSVTLK